VSKAIILSILGRLEAAQRPAAAAPQANPRPAIELRAWACVPATFKTVVAGDKQLVVDKKLVSLKAASDDQLLGLIATYDRDVIASSMLEASASFDKLVTSNGISSTTFAVSHGGKVAGDGIAWSASGKAVYWKGTEPSFLHAAAVTPTKTVMAEFKLEPGILDGIDAVNLQLLADQTGTSVRALRSMNLSRDPKVLAELALRTIKVVSVFKLEGEKQVTMNELVAAVEGLRPQPVPVPGSRIKAETVPGNLRPLTSNDMVETGDKVFWTDPQDGFSSRWDVVERGGGDDDIITLESGAEVLIHELSVKGSFKGAAITKEFDPKGEQVQPSGKDLYNQLLDDDKRPAVIIDVEPEKDPLKVKQTLYTAKEVSIKDLQKNAGKYALAVWCKSMDEAKKQAKWLELRRADYQPLPDHWAPPAGEKDGEGIQEVKDEANGGKRQVVKEIKTPSSPQAIEKTDKVDNTAEQVQKLRQGQVMAGEVSYTVAEYEDSEGQKEWAVLQRPSNVWIFPKGEETKATKEEAEAKAAELRVHGSKVKASDLRIVRVTFDDGNVINTNMAAGVSDEEIKAYYAPGTEFNVGSGENDKMAKVTKVEIVAGNEGYVDQDRKPVKPEDVDKGRKMAKERREAMESMDDELKRTGRLTNHPVKAERTEDQQAFEDGLSDGNLDSEDVDGADVRVYDNGGETFDRYTIVVENPETQERSWLGASENPFHPSGFGQHLGDRVQEGAHLGNKIKFAELPEQVQKFVREEAKDYAMKPEVEGSLTAAPKKKDEKKPKKAEKPAEKKPKAEPKPTPAANPEPPKDAEATVGDAVAPSAKPEGEAPAAEADDFETKARQELAKALGADPDDLAEEKVFYPMDVAGGNVVAFSLGDKEYVVFADYDYMEKAAQESVRNDFGPNGEGPMLFNKDFVMGHVDREALKDYMTQVFEEFAEQDVDELSDKEKEEWLEKAGHLPDNYLDDENFDVETFFEGFREDWVNEQVGDKLGNDGGESYWTDNVGEEDFRKIVVDNNFIDVESLVEEAVSSDGPSHFLNSYDGNYTDLPGGMVYMRTN
jgi:hypothetical protein